ncbi:hypothetical protein [Thiobacillus denitrificans]|nr:hypothetical protein [Thiobacillus denitrificans]
MGILFWIVLILVISRADQVPVRQVRQMTRRMCRIAVVRFLNEDNETGER